MTQEAPLGYRYHNPAGSGDYSLANVEVRPSVATGDIGFQALAIDHLEVRSEALRAAYSGSSDVDSGLVAQAVDPFDPKQRAEVAQRLKSASRASLPGYRALIAVPPEVDSHGWAAVGTAEPTKTGKRRSLLRRVVGEETVDVSNIFVRPFAQQHQVGSVLLHAALDSIADEVPVVAYAFSIERVMPRLLVRLGFEPVGSRSAELFGKMFNKAEYRGPNRGELVTQLEDAHPWFRQRTPIEAS